MKIKFFLFVFLTIICVCCNGARILAVINLPGKSHWNMFQAVLIALSKNGHEVDVYGHFPPENSVPRYNFFSIAGSSKILTNSFELSRIKDASTWKLVQLIANFCGIQICKESFEAKQLLELRNRTVKYDVVITELFGSECMLGWAWYFGAPSVVMTTSTDLPWGSDRFGLPDNPSYIPNYFTSYNDKMTLSERIINSWMLVTAKIGYYYYSYLPSNRIAKQFFGESMPDLDVLAYNSSLHLLNTHISINSARPLVPNVVEVAGIHIDKPKPLDKHFTEHLQPNQKGIIYLSMGSLMLSESFPSETLQPIFDALSQIPYNILWKANRSKFSKSLRIPENIHFETWMPQLDILCDPRVKLFISHGGMMGTQEAVYCGIPILGIPLFADQRMNLKHAESLGFAFMLDLDNINEKTFSDALNEVLSNPKYSDNAKKISLDFKDRPLGPLETAIFWIEYVIRHRGAPQLQSAAKYLSWYQYYLIDVITVTLIVPFMLLFILARIVLKQLGGRNKVKTS